jgi:hypothetical protein
MFLGAWIFMQKLFPDRPRAQQCTQNTALRKQLLRPVLDKRTPWLAFFREKPSNCPGLLHFTDSMTEAPMTHGFAKR